MIPEPVYLDYVPVSIDKYMELLIDFRKTELSRIRRQLKHGKRQTLTSKFLEDIDRRMLECAQELCQKPEKAHKNYES